MRDYAFPYVIQGLADLPESLQPAGGLRPPPDDPIQLILVIPRHTQTRLKNLRAVPPQALVFTAAGVLQVQERAAPAGSSPPAVTYLRGADLLYVEHTLVLLYGRLELAGVMDGQLTRLVVEYNTVRQHLLQPALEQFMRLAYGPRPVPPTGDETEALLARLAQQSQPVSAGLRLYTLLPDEQLLGYVLQPRVAGRLGRVGRPATLLALTDRAVLLIEENKLKGAAYGWRITGCPRACVTGIETQPKDAWREVCVHLARNQVTGDQRLTLATDTAQAWEALWRQGALTPA